MAIKPLIGMTGGFSSTDKAGNTVQLGDQKNKLAASYVAAITQAGGLPVLLPVCDLYSSDGAILDRLDGILFTGGCDLDPDWYHQSPAGSNAPNPERDRQELFLLRRVLTQTTLPVLGICRGCQLLNVAQGGSLFQDIDTARYGVHITPGQLENVLSHTVTLTPGSLLEQILGGTASVNSFHHQAADRLGDGLTTAAADPHGLAEGLELPSRAAFTLGVQWHPEGLCQEFPEHQRIFDAFVRAAQK